MVGRVDVALTEVLRRTGSSECIPRLTLSVTSLSLDLACRDSVVPARSRRCDAEAAAPPCHRCGARAVDAGREGPGLRDTGGVDITELTRKILDRRERENDPLRIVQAGHPALRRRAVTAHERLDVELLLELAEAMTLTMREAPGVGLAAPQVGLPLRFYVIEDSFAADEGEDPDDDLLERRPLALRYLLDPVLEPLGTERVYAFEGCLSADGWQSIVPRSRRVRLRATELLEDGGLREVDEEHLGWTARILQHETDHLAGTLCHDLAVPRSYIDAAYSGHYADLGEAVRLLGLSGEITELGEGEVVIG